MLKILFYWFVIILGTISLPVGCLAEGFTLEQILRRWSDWVRAYRSTGEFFDRKLAASGKPQ